MWLRGRFRGECGFTLIETMIIVALLGVLAVALVIKNPIERMKVTAASGKIKADLRYARKLAVSTQDRAGITFNANGYSVFANVVAPTALANSPAEGCSSDASGDFVVDFTAARCSELSGLTLSFSAATVAFDSLGSPVDAAGAALGTQTVDVTGPPGTKIVTIEAQTGRVSD
jgi:Tfp pilus assembly protein FimT